MQPKYSEKTLLRVCYATAAVLVTIIVGIAYTIGKVLDDIT